MEYWRTKRIEPRIFRLVRNGKITFYDMIKASQQQNDFLPDARSGQGSLEDRIEALELRLGDYIKGVTITQSITVDLVPIDEIRIESGVYGEEFKFEHRKLSGTMEERISQLETMLAESIALLPTFFRVLINKGLISEERLKEMLAAPYFPSYENGARIVAKAWTDASFKAKLIGDAKRTLREMGFALNRTSKLVVVENTESVHNVIVCTLCSCYPYELLGNPPWWYKHDSYKRAIVENPRRTLTERFSFKVPQEVEVRVYDSTSDIRYMVLPRRPEGSGKLTEEELASLVTQESLIGVGEVSRPVVAKTT